MANQIAYGFYDLKSLFANRVTNDLIPTLNTAIDATFAEHNRQLDAMTSLFIRRTTQFKQSYASAVLANLQPLDQNARALPIQVAGRYEVAFPLQRAGTAWGTNYITRVKMTVEEVNNTVITLQMADKRWMRYHMLAALYANVTWSFNDLEHGVLTIPGLANGDTTQYQIMAGTDAGTTDTHYLAQAAAISDAADPFPTIVPELKEHPENSGDVVVLIPTNLKAAVQALAGYFPAADRNIDLGQNTARLTGTLGVDVPGELFGYHDAGAWLVEWKNLPDNYMIATMTGGERAIAMREEPEQELQGFKRVADRENYPFFESQYLRIAGFGAWNRVGALVYRIGNAAYTAAPTGYVAPI